jgi:hypothetical protein
MESVFIRVDPCPILGGWEGTRTITGNGTPSFGIPFRLKEPE